MRDPLLIPVSDPSRAGEVRRAAVSLATALDFSEEDVGRVAIVATEAATNLVKHATGGVVVLRSLSPSEGTGIELLAIDGGPGVADVGRCLRDGFSTAGTPGTGLGALRRLSDVFDISSVPTVGTVLISRIGSSANSAVEMGAVSLPVAGEEACGDAWAVVNTPSHTAVLVADGLGHGPSAAVAAQATVRVFRTATRLDPVEILQSAHTALRPTRGAAAAVAVLDRASGALSYAGIGNIVAAVIGSSGRQGLVSLSGTLGHEVRKIQAFEYKWLAGGTLVMHSDGLGTQWDLGRYPGLATRHAALIAATLFRDSRRERDDATVVVVRAAGGVGPTT